MAHDRDLPGNVVKTAKLTGVALDRAVLKCECPNLLPESTRHVIPQFSSDWSQGGSIIERENITILRAEDEYLIGADGYCVPGQRLPLWCAVMGQIDTQCSHESERYPAQYEIHEADVTYGPTPLIAAMRCYCLSILGPEIDIPKELM